MKNKKINQNKTIFELADLTGKKAVVTGGGGHLGFQMSKALLELGADVIVLARDKEKIKSLSKEFGKKISFIKVDLNNKEEVTALDKKLPSMIHILINNFYTWPTNPHFEKMQWDEAVATMTAGIVSPLFLSKVVFPKMKKGGSIINIGSMYGMISPDFRIYRNSGMGNALEYGATKAALIQATKYLAVKGAPSGIRVNAISPGPFSRPGAFDNGKDWFKEELINKMPLHRIGENWELKGVIAFLASDLSSYVTGQNIAVDGGWTIW
ncbi:MAG: SDR family oxidoreductase [Patescibacteria group bacterium]